MSAAEQLCLEVSEQIDIEPMRDVDLVDAIIIAHGGDPRRAIEALMEDADFLREQLSIAAAMMSRGYVRGWRPKYERLS